jgi:hypothetical protein
MSNFANSNLDGDLVFLINQVLNGFCAKFYMQILVITEFTLKDKERKRNEPFFEKDRGSSNFGHSLDDRFSYSKHDTHNWRS